MTKPGQGRGAFRIECLIKETGQAVSGVSGCGGGGALGGSKVNREWIKNHVKGSPWGGFDATPNQMGDQVNAAIHWGLVTLPFLWIKTRHEGRPPPGSGRK